MILKPDGNGKLSKRDADKQGFPIFPTNWEDAGGEVSIGFKEQGYLPEAMINFLALLGWNPGSEQELFTLQQLEQTFSLDRIVKSGAKFDIGKAQWFNQNYLRTMPGVDLIKFLVDELRKVSIEFTEEKVQKVIQLLRERIVFPQDLMTNGQVYFVAPTHYDQQVVQKKWNLQVVEFLSEYREKIENSEHWDAQVAHTLLTEQLEQKGWGFGKIMPGLRLALTGVGKGPDLMQIMEILGKEETMQRLNTAIHQLSIQTEKKG